MLPLLTTLPATRLLQACISSWLVKCSSFLLGVSIFILGLCALFSIQRPERSKIQARSQHIAPDRPFAPCFTQNKIQCLITPYTALWCMVPAPPAPWTSPSIPPSRSCPALLPGACCHPQRASPAAVIHSLPRTSFWKWHPALTCWQESISYHFKWGKMIM